MSQRAEEKNTGGLIFAALVSGLFTAAALGLVLSMMGVSRLETGVFAILSAATISAFVYRERSLTRTLAHRDMQRRMEVSKLDSKLDNLYNHSVACIAYFDAGTLSVDLFSPGLLKLLRLAPDYPARGKSMAELLRVPHSKMEVLVDQVQRPMASDTQHELLAEDSFGCQLQLVMQAHYDPEVHMVTASFLTQPVQDKEELMEMENARKDLDRFRRGMYRRESRILELKEEVNELLIASGQEGRYRVDRTMDDTRTPIPGAGSKPGSEVTRE